MSIEYTERGPEVAIQCAWLISGVALAYWVDFGFTRLDTQISWVSRLTSHQSYANACMHQRFPIAFQAFFALISGAGMLMLPDTPRWYYARNRLAEGDSVLQRLHGLPADHPNVQNQKNEILASIALEEEAENRLTLLSLVWDNTELRVGRRMVRSGSLVRMNGTDYFDQSIAFWILSIQQMMGIFYNLPPPVLFSLF